MVWRIASLLLCQFAGGAVGWLFGLPGALTAGVVLGALAWLAMDLVRGQRVLRWLRADTSRGAPLLGGTWGTVASRVQRGLRGREQQTQDAVQRLDDFLSAIQASPNGVVLLDAQGRIEWCNQTAAGHFGLDAQRDLLQPIGNLLRDPAFGAYYAGGNYAREATLQGPRSTASWPVKLAVHLHPYGEGRKLLLSRDVTALEQAEAMRRDFVANVSHEIRTPLTVLTGFVETLQNLPLSEEERARYLALMAQQAQRMQTLVSDLLTLSRLEGSPLPGAGDWVPVPALAAACEQEGRALSGTLGKAQELRFGPVPQLEVAGSANELQSALSNLVTNAVRYTPADGAIDVQWRTQADGRLEFSVRDTGAGIAPEHVPRLTERFYRVDRSRSRETGGTGLGLAIVKHVVQRHGAELKIESTLGAGSSFSIVFPASRLRVRPAGTPARPATESAAG